MPRSLSAVRLDDTATCRYVMFVEGLTDAYTTDESGGLIGTSTGSWIGLSETAIGGSEVFGTRRVRGGLIPPDSVTFEVDIKSGQLQPSPAAFGVLDVDDTLSTLFANEGKTFDVLGERIAPGTTVLGTSVVLYPGDGLNTTNPRGKQIGIERIGASGQRRSCPAIPFSLVGFDHAVAPHLPPTWISTSPLVFAGRMVTLYRVYKLRPDLDDSDPTAWATWDQCHAAGDLVWWGVLRDAGQVGANDVWSIECHGPDGMTRKTLGTRNTSRWMKISADLTLDVEQTYACIGFHSHPSSLAVDPVDETPVYDQYFDASIFDHQITENNRSAICSDLNAWIQSTLDGTDTNVAQADGDFDTWSDSDGFGAFLSAGVNSEGVFSIRRVQRHTDATEWGAMYITLHERVWRILGWEPERQHQDGTIFGDVTRCRFVKHYAGDEFQTPIASGMQVPADGYWTAEFTTVTPGGDQTGTETEDYDNGGAPREYYPMHTAPVFVLNPGGPQVVRLIEEDSNTVYLEGQPTAGVESASDDVDDTATELGRWFALRGTFVRIADDPETQDKIEISEEIKIHLVAKGEWVEGTRHGDVGRGASDLYPSILLTYYEDPRAWGWNNRRLTTPWAGKLEGKGEIEIAPLHAYHYGIYTKPFEKAGSVWFQVMLSTGSSTGYDAPHDEGGSLDAGDNTPALADAWGADIELADMGLGIPHQLLADQEDVVAAFDTVPGGYGGSLNRVRMGYVGPYQASDVLDSIMRPRGLSWSLHGKKLGVYKLGPVSPEGVDMVITEDDLYGGVADPTSVIPSQALRITGQLDRVDLEYRWDADAGKTAEVLSVPALDAAAYTRTGELVEQIKDHGLAAPQTWFAQKREEITGVGNWEQDFRQLWGVDAAEFFAKRHFSIGLRLARHLGQDAMPGTSVRITNPWPVHPAGGRGITGRTGRIIRATHNLKDESTDIEAIVFAGQEVVHYAPAVRIVRVTGTEIEWADYLGAENDGLGFSIPGWVDSVANPQVLLYQRSGVTWTLAFTGTIDSSTVDLTTRTAELTSAPGSSILRDRDTWMVLRDRANQGADWPAEVYGVHTDTDLTIGDAATKAPPFVD